jgi:hypothetical protein
LSKLKQEKIAQAMEKIARDFEQNQKRNMKNMQGTVFDFPGVLFVQDPVTKLIRHCEKEVLSGVLKHFKSNMTYETPPDTNTPLPQSLPHVLSAE